MINNIHLVNQKHCKHETIDQEALLLTINSSRTPVSMINMTKCFSRAVLPKRLGDQEPISFRRWPGCEGTQVQPDGVLDGLLSMDQ